MSSIERRSLFEAGEDVGRIAEARAILRKYLRGTRWTIISADTRRAGPHELIRARTDLWTRLGAYRKRVIDGSWQGAPERAVIVDDLPLPEAKRLAVEFGQAAFLTCEGEWYRPDSLDDRFVLARWACDMVSFDVSDSWSEIEVPREGGIKLRFTLRKAGKR